MKTIKVFLLLTVFIMAANSSGSIDRKALISRHNITSTKIDALSPLSVGNGRFVFTADITGLQTFPEAYKNGMPLTTMAQWGRHSFKNVEAYKESDIFVDVNTAGRKVPYQIVQNSDAASYFRANPHQTNLARIGFFLKKSDGSLASANDITNIHQQLDLWTGILTSSFELESKKINVKTFCHPDIDQISFEIESDLISENRLAVEIAFPYANGNWGKDPADWNSPDKHTTKLKKINKSSVDILHDMDSLIYNCEIRFSHAEIEETKKHHYLLTPVSNKWQCLIAFGKKIKEIDNFASAINKTVAHWKNFWLTGGAIDLSQSTDPRWQELERRIVISQYLTGIQSAQDYPPAETGLTTASWFGKFHLEMHWWHHVHFALWNRTKKFIPSLQWYKEILPQAQKTAKKQGYDGARWPKMTDPSGRNSPSSIGSLLIWQQPHPIYYAELLYLQNPSKQTLNQYNDLVFETAKFMASFPVWNENDKCFDLGPPLISAREHGTETFEQNKNPTFELAYWRWALLTANKWKQRLKLEPELKWENIADHLACWPTENNIYYIEQQFPIVDEGEHPCMLGAFGILPESPQLNKKTMEKTLSYVLTKWKWEDTWGWDFPMMAMTAARLGRGDLAIDSLLYDTPKNTYLLNGHNYQRENLPCYLPGNGGLLTAVAMMAAGWQNCPNNNAPGFPNDGRWNVKWENLNKMP